MTTSGLHEDSKVTSRAHLRPLAEYDIDPDTGFLPRAPLPRLADPSSPLKHQSEFLIWEKALSLAPEVLRLTSDHSPEAVSMREEGEVWRTAICSWPVLSISPLKEDACMLRRAHVVLAWLVHYYVHSLPSPEQPQSNLVIPAALAVPLVGVSLALGIAPVLTFADTVLWNWDVYHGSADEDDYVQVAPTINDIFFTHSFSNTQDETSFYAVCAACELLGAQILQIIKKCTMKQAVNDLPAILALADGLESLAEIIGELTTLMSSMRDQVDPRVFCFKIRPWFGGSGINGKEWVYQGVAARDLKTCQNHSGPSGGQSSVIHALDIFLGINHQCQHNGIYAERKRFLGFIRTDSANSNQSKESTNFMQRMRQYMPAKHRAYLEDLERSSELASIRTAIEQMSELHGPYNKAVQALIHFRNRHLQIACRYVVVFKDRGNGSMAITDETAQVKPVKGTGGNHLSLLLKAGRDATCRTMIK
ncbi:Indoleamine 2,3-dioxygenase [Gymnopus androsaceus JB14]|uniref:Indoleamine 2,3-dioxygenase n=1 Tax=Gymnopus androsaceus JB14 TaxID=1447944 RepID=A0A6A4HPU3_9AGAR|nr:Indoleamine 2,3-dioxygenase [Gymnopus androsaceus JB14]